MLNLKYNIKDCNFILRALCYKESDSARDQRIAWNLMVCSSDLNLAFGLFQTF